MKGPVELFLGDRAQRLGRSNPGVREDDVDVSLLLLDGRVQPIEVRQIRDVTLNARDVLANLLDGYVESPFADGR